MGLIKAIASSIGGKFADSWLEVLEADNMDDKTVFTKGVFVRKDSKRNNNRKGESDIINNGSIIHVYDNQCVLLVDGGKIIDYCAEPGYYKVDNTASPSLFNGELWASVKETFRRIKFSGVPSASQKAFFINLQEIKGIKFGTPGPLNYFDSFYNAELFVRAHGDYSIKVTNPLLFYEQVIPKNKDHVDITDINDQYIAEFLQGFSAALNQMSAEGERISFLASRAPQLAAHMQSALDEDWNKSRGFEVDHVGVASVTYTDESQALINMRNQGAMMSQPGIREGYVQSAIATGIQNAGSNESGAGAAFMGVGMGLGAGGNFMGAASQTNWNQMQMQQGQQGYPQQGYAPQGQPQQAYYGQAPQQAPQAAPAPAPAPAEGAPAEGAPAPAEGAGFWYCPKCGTKNDGNFCPKDGTPRPQF